MMRTPFFILAIAAASMMFLVFSVSGVCSVMKSARLSRSSSSTFSTPMSLARSGDRNGSKAMTFMRRPSARSADDRADIAAADHAQRLAGDLDAHEAVLLPLAGLGRGIGLRDFARQRQHQRDRVFGGGDRIAERRVHHDDALGGGRRDLDIVDADAGAADHLQARRRFDDLRGRLGGRADGEAVIVADDLGELVLVLAEFGWKSTSMPRSLKICTAAGESASEMRTLGADMMDYLSSLLRKPRLAAMTRNPARRSGSREFSLMGTASRKRPLRTSPTHARRLMALLDVAPFALVVDAEHPAFDWFSPACFACISHAP